MYRLKKELEEIMPCQEKTEANNSGDRWEPLQPNMLKPNFDIAFSATNKKAGMGVIIRNAKDLVITTRYGWRDLCFPLLLECNAALMGIRAACAVTPQNPIPKKNFRVLIS